MIHNPIKQLFAATCCLLLLAGCDGVSSAQNTPASATVDKSEGDALFDNAILTGTVETLETDGFTVLPQETTSDGAIGMQAAPGHEDVSTVATVRPEDDCRFEHATITRETGAVETQSASASDVKRDAYVAVYGEKDADGTIGATRVVLVSYAGMEGE